MRALLLCAITATTLSTGLAVPAPQQPAATAATNPERLAAYEWRPLSRTDPATLAEGAASLAEAGGNQVLLDISEVADLVESGDSAGLEAYQQRLGEYMAGAAGVGVAVGALAGSPHWISPGARYVTDILLDFVREYNAGTSGPPLTSLQFDLEPWATPQWSREKRQLTRQLLDTVAHVADAAAAVPSAERIPVAFALPFWLDGTGAPRAVRYQGQSMSPTAHVMRLLDTANGPRNAVAVMAYRDRTDGSNGSVALLADEFTFAEAHQGRVGVMVAQEISPVEPSSITFHEEGWDALVAAAEELTTAYGDRASFEGLAVNDLRSIAAARSGGA